MLRQAIGRLSTGITISMKPVRVFMKSHHPVRPSNWPLPTGWILCSIVCQSLRVLAQSSATAALADRQKLYMATCNPCHKAEAGVGAPAYQVLTQMPPRAIVAVLETGKMRLQAKDLTSDQRKAVAQWLTGRVVWKTPTPSCNGKKGCMEANSAAPTVMPGIVFAGTLDGHMRAYSTTDGHILWDYDTAKPFQAVNGIERKDGSIDGPSPVIADGMLLVNSGYGSFGEMPGTYCWRLR